MRHPSFSAALAAVLCCLVSCVAPVEPERPVAFVEPLAPLEGMTETATRPDDPVDVFVAEVMDDTTDRSAPAEDLRRELYAGLVGRLYSPLALEWGDAQRLEEAAGAIPAAAPRAADAVLEARVQRWDTSRLESSGWVDAEVELRLIDLRGGESAQRWARRVGRRLELEAGLLKQATPREVQQYGARILAVELLELLPARDPVLGTR